MEEENRYFLIEHNAIDTSKSLELKINSPLLCPVCGKKEIFTDYKVKEGNIYISVYVCKEHYNLQKINFSVKSIGVMIIITIISIILSSLTGLQLISVLGVTIGITLFLAFSLKSIKREESVKKFVNIECFKFKSVICIKRNDWADEFKQNNGLKEISLKSFNHKRLEILEKNLMVVSLCLILGSLLGSLFSLALDLPHILLSVFQFSGIISLVLLLGSKTYLDVYKIPKTKYENFFGESWKMKYSID